MPCTQWSKILTSTALSAVLIVANLSTISCGGSRKPSSTTTKKVVAVPPTAAPPSSTPTPITSNWTKDYFLPQSYYINRCQFPRSGINTTLKRPYPDRKGTMLDELYFLRSVTNETYLFQSDITDMDPATYNVVQDNFPDHVQKMKVYFDELKSKKTTASGRPKDQYHFIQLTSDYYSGVENRPQLSFGISWVLLSGYETRDNRDYMKIPRDLRVRFVENGSPAAELVAGSPKVKRGDKLLKVNQTDFINSNSSDVNAIFTPDGTKYTTIVLQDVDTKLEKTVVLKAKEISRQPVNVSKVIDVDDEKVGYIHYTTFNTKNSDSSFNNAVKSLKSAGVDDLVVDLRYNGGGYIAVASMVAYMIAGHENTREKTFEQVVTLQGPGFKFPFYNAGGGPPYFSVPLDEFLASLDLNKVYILTTGRTCSASESLINGLVGIDLEVIQIGGTTCGKPYGFDVTHNCGISYYTIQFSGINHKGFGEFADGFVPSTATSFTEAKVKGCVVADDFNHQLGSEKEALLAAALKYRKDGKCPAPPTPPSPPSAIDVVASSHGRFDEITPRSTIEVPDDPFYEVERIRVPVDQ